jgi:hypothetical protein
MPTQDDLDSIHPPAFLLADRMEWQEVESTRDRAAASSRVFKVIALIAAATAIGAAALSVEDPVMLLANVTAPLVGNSPPQPAAGEPSPAVQLAAAAPAPIQSAAETQPVPQTATDAPAQGQVALSEGANESRSERIEPASEDLFLKFQAWAADKDAQAQVDKDAQVQVASVQPVQDTPVQSAKRIARTPHRLAPRHSRVYPVRNARAEVRPQPRRRAQAAPPPASDPRAQEQSVQASQPQSFLSTFGLRN